jgi:acetyl-CoA C-acetyltransferase
VPAGNKEGLVPEAYIIDAVRLAGGRRGGALANVHPAQLGAKVLDALVERTGIDGHLVEDVVMGCVTQVGEQAINVARNAVLTSSLPDSVPAVTVDRQCGSSLQAVQFAAQAIIAGVQDVVIAGGTESMTRVPMGSASRLAREAGMGTGPYPRRVFERYSVELSQFRGAQLMADKYRLSREEMDQYALESHRRAARARDEGLFGEIVPVRLDDGRIHNADEGIRSDASLEAIRAVKTLEDGGTITAANASQLCDGASAILLTSEQAARQYGLIPIGRVVAMSVSGGDPVIMLEEPIHATRRVLDRARLRLADIDLFEVNEAFASVPLAWRSALGVDADRLNVHGGAIALGHPLGATGAKLAATLLSALAHRKAKRGLLAICEGNGMANAMIVERL